IPFIIVSGTIGEDTAVLAMKAGANDYLTKGQLKRLVPAVERELREAGVRAGQRPPAPALPGSAERTRPAGPATHDPIWDRYPATGEVWLGDAVRRCWGWDVETVDAGWRLGRVHPEDAERVRAGLHEAVERGRAAWWDEYRFRRSDGTHAPVL